MLLYYGALLGGIGLVGFGGLWTLGILFPVGFGREAKTTIERILSSKVISRIEKRYQGGLTDLRRLGFEEHCYYWEITGPFSLISSFLVFLIMCSKNEIIKIRSPLRISTGYPLLNLPYQGTFATVYAFEIQFLTLFTDGTTLITGNDDRTPSFVDENFQVYRQGESQTVEAAWHQHQIRVEAFKDEGKQEKENNNFSDYVDIVTKVETILLANNIFQSTEWWGSGMAG